MLSWAHIGLAGTFGWSVIEARGLYLARHLSLSLFMSCQEVKQKFNIDDVVGDRRENLNQV